MTLVLLPCRWLPARPCHGGFLTHRRAAVRRDRPVNASREKLSVGGHGCFECRLAGRIERVVDVGEDF